MHLLVIAAELALRTRDELDPWNLPDFQPFVKLECVRTAWDLAWLFAPPRHSLGAALHCQGSAPYSEEGGCSDPVLHFRQQLVHTVSSGAVLITECPDDGSTVLRRVRDGKESQ